VKKGLYENMYNAGIIGFGGMGHQHFEMLSKYGRAKAKGMFDINPKRNEVAESLGLTAYSSLDSLLADTEIDIVIIASLNNLHKEHSVSAMAAGKHVICEKPATVTSKELREVIDAAEKYRKVFTINQNRRTNEDFLLMKKHAGEGLLGRVYAIESRVEGSRGIPEGWRTQRSFGGGMMLDWGVHLIDQIMYMVNEKVISVFCRMYNVHYTEVEDNFNLILTFESGLTAQIEVGTNNYIAHPRWYVTGEQGTLQIDDWDCKGRIARCTDRENVWGDGIILTRAGPSKTMAPRSESSIETTYISADEFRNDEGLHAVYDQFFDAVEGRAELTITAEQAMRVMKVMEAAFLSHETKSAVL
jgi:predicted dehydrogenase